MDTDTKSAPQQNHVSAGDIMLRQVRAAFVSRGETLHAWCKKNQVDWSYAHGALTGKNDFPKARELRQRILRASSLSVGG